MPGWCAARRRGNNRKSSSGCCRAFVIFRDGFSTLARVSASRTERLLNLLIALLNTKYGLRRSELRRKGLPRHHEQRRRLRPDVRTRQERAAPVRLRRRDRHGPRAGAPTIPATTRYRIGKESNRLPDVSLTPEECTVLILAAQLWEHAALGSAAVERRAQAAGRRRPGRRRTPRRRPAAHQARRPGLRGPGRRDARPAPRQVPLPRRQHRQGGRAAGGALGPGQPLRPVVPRGPRPGPRATSGSSGSPA